MRTQKILLFVTTGLLSLALAACGTGSQEADQAHTFQYSGNEVEVTVDGSGDWAVQFDDTAAKLYAVNDQGEETLAAFGQCESRQEYQERLALAASCPDFTQTEYQATYTDSFGVQTCLWDLGGDVCYRIEAQPDADAQAIFPRFGAVLVQIAQPEEEDDLYLTLVNRTHKLPEGWEEKIQLVDTANYSGEPIRVEQQAYDAYQALRAALLEEGVDIELESSYRSVSRQEELWAEYEKNYGLDYCRQYVAVPGFSEHHTGFAIDTNLIQPDSQADEETKAQERTALWAKVHAKLPEYGFILRYLEGKEDITGYSYEPWHLRYVGSPGIAGEIMSRGITLEEYLDKVEPSDAIVDYGSSTRYTEAERQEAQSVLRAEFDTWPGFQLHSVRYAGDEAAGPDRLPWLDSFSGGKDYVQCMAFTTELHTPGENSGGFDPDTEYTDYPWWLARTFGGGWEVVSTGSWG